MSFTIPNEAVATHPLQAAPDSTDIDALVRALNGEGVLSGCAVTPNGGDAQVVVAAGEVVQLGGTRRTITGGTVNLGGAHATLPRRDIICAQTDADGIVGIAGTAAAVPVKPALPANRAILAEVYFPPADHVIVANEIIDKRAIIPAPPSSAMTLISDQIVSGSAVDQVTFSSIPQTYKHLLLIFRIEGGGTAFAVQAAINSDSTEYSYTYMHGTSPSPFIGTSGSASQWVMMNAPSNSNQLYVGELLLPDYTVADAQAAKWSVGTETIIAVGSGEQSTSAAVTSLVIKEAVSGAQFGVGSRFSLYGVN